MVGGLASEVDVGLAAGVVDDLAVAVDEFFHDVSHGINEDTLERALRYLSTG